MFECIGCPGDTFDSKNDLEAHVAAIHFDYLPYECEKCRFAKFPTEYAVRYHWEFEHQITEYCIRYRVSPDLITKRQQVSAYVQQCVEPRKLHSSTETLLNPLLNAMEEKPIILPESSITEGGNHFPPTSITPVLKELLGSTDLAADTRLGDALRKINKRKRPMSNNDLQLDGIPPSKTGSLSSIGASAASSSSSSALSLNNSPPAVVECTDCKRLIANQATSVMYHTNSRHLKLPVFTCIPCNRIWTTISRSDLLKHVKNFHNNDMSVIIDKKDEYVVLIKEKCRQLFPNRGYSVSNRRPYATRRKPLDQSQDGPETEDSE